ncbi:ribose ABC transporter ATP-binding protein [Bacillus freudenreichii]|nr:ribose ABC transporter ATP-binding protein [Bacillus freudenreichii]
MKDSRKHSDNDMAIEVIGVSKSYPGVQALSDISMSIEWGSIHGLAGENGSGKSTLLRILSGLEPASSGEVRFSGESLSRTKNNLTKHVAMVTQEPSLVESLTVAENIALASNLYRKWFVNWKSSKEIAESILQRLGADEIDTEGIVANLPPDQQQIISIARALAANPQILLLDEATSSLTEDQTERLFLLLDELRAEGKIIIFISHRLKEYIRLCDKITVLRDGSYICKLQHPNFSEEDIVTAMVGRKMSEYFPPRTSSDYDEIALHLKKFNSLNAKEVSLAVKKGEIFVFAGLVGCGRSEMLRGLFGVHPSHGEVEIYGKAFSPHSPRDSVQRGISYIPSERKAEGIVAGLSVLENGVLSLRLRNSIWKWVNFNQEKEIMHRMVKSMNIKTPSLETDIQTLSGGNQQKVILARSIATHPKILLLDEPTRGIDVGAKAQIYQLLRQLSKEGVTVIISTSDLQEALGIADRVGVMFRGHLKKVLNPDELSEENVMYYATGN